MILGIVSLVFTCSVALAMLGFFASIVSIWCGAVAVKKGSGDKGLAVTGITLSIVAVLILLIYVVLVFLMADGITFGDPEVFD